MSSRFLTCSVGVLALTWCGVALGNPRALPFTYQHEQSEAGGMEIEQYIDFSPIRARAASSGSPLWYGLTQFQTEFEHGITDRLELDLALVLDDFPVERHVDRPRAGVG